MKDNKEIIKELKKDLIFVRNGGAITPILFDIEECLRQAREESFKAGQEAERKRLMGKTKGILEITITMIEEGFTRKEIIDYLKNRQKELTNLLNQ